MLDKFYHQITGPEGRGPSDGSKGDIPKLVFLHGVMGYAANFRRIAKAFEDRFQVLVYDQRGHGRSFQPESGYSPEDYAMDLKEILDELQWEQVHLVGHSMGGRVAYHFAAHHSEQVTRLVIEDIGPSLEEARSSLVLRLLNAIPVPFASRRIAKAWFDKEFLEIFAQERQKVGLAAYLYANLTENERNEAVWRFSERAIRESVEQGHSRQLWDDIKSLSVPTLLIRGGLSNDLPRAIFTQAIESNPLISGVEIIGAGHWVHSEQPELFIECLDRFFRGLEQRRDLALVSPFDPTSHT